MNAYIPRPLLYLSRQHDGTLCRHLAQQGWKPHFASSVSDLEGMGMDSQPMAGLLDLRAGVAPADLQAVEPWLALRNIGWIGLTDGASDLTPVARNMLGLYFIDYCTAPCDDAHVDYALGHAVGMATLRSSTAQAFPHAPAPTA